MINVCLIYLYLDIYEYDTTPKLGSAKKIAPKFPMYRFFINKCMMIVEFYPCQLQNSFISRPMLAACAAPVAQVASRWRPNGNFCIGTNGMMFFFWGGWTLSKKIWRIPRLFIGIYEFINKSRYECKRCCKFVGICFHEVSFINKTEHMFFLHRHSHKRKNSGAEGKPAKSGVSGLRRWRVGGLDLPQTQDASHHQDYVFFFAGNFGNTYICHCWEGGRSNTWAGWQWKSLALMVLMLFMMILRDHGLCCCYCCWWWTWWWYKDGNDVWWKGRFTERCSHQWMTGNSPDHTCFVVRTTKLGPIPNFCSDEVTEKLPIDANIVFEFYIIPL